MHASHVLPPPSLQPSLQKGPFPDRPDELGGDIEFAVFASDPPLLQEATVLIRSRRAVLLADLGFKQSDGLGLPAVMEFATAQLRVRGTCRLGVCAPVAMLLRQGVLGLWRCEQPGVEDWAIVHPLQATCLGRPSRAVQHGVRHRALPHTPRSRPLPPGSYQPRMRPTAAPPAAPPTPLLLHPQVSGKLGAPISYPACQKNPELGRAWRDKVLGWEGWDRLLCNHLQPVVANGRQELAQCYAYLG